MALVCSWLMFSSLMPAAMLVITDIAATFSGYTRQFADLLN